MKNALPELKALKWQPVFDEIRKQMKLAGRLFRLKRMHFGFLAARGRNEIKALYRKSKAAKV
jgi:hypothetical protein